MKTLTGIVFLITPLSCANDAPTITDQDYENAKWARVRNVCASGEMPTTYKAFLSEVNDDMREDYNLFEDEVAKKNGYKLPCGRMIYVPDLDKSGEVLGYSVEG